MTAYLAPEDFLNELLQELHSITKVYGRLVLTSAAPQPTVWAEQVWQDCQFHEFESITKATLFLKSKSFLWFHYSHEHHRRAQLIQDGLPKLKDRTLNFLDPLPESNLNAWALLEKNALIYSTQISSPFILGQCRFKETKEPPSRAYLKLWELMTVYKVKPDRGSKVIDFGSCPGGWTWVLQKIGCEVISIDRAPLDPLVAALPKVQFMKTNAFNLRPQDLGKVDWFFSDIICYPEKLYELVTQWQDSGLCENFVCTIKFQGETDFKTLEKFKKIKGARVQHLFHNKHEVTVWIKS